MNLCSCRIRLLRSKVRPRHRFGAIRLETGNSSSRCRLSTRPAGNASMPRIRFVQQVASTHTLSVAAPRREESNETSDGRFGELRGLAGTSAPSPLQPRRIALRLDLRVSHVSNQRFEGVIEDRRANDGRSFSCPIGSFVRSSPTISARALLGRSKGTRKARNVKRATESTSLAVSRASSRELASSKFRLEPLGALSTHGLPRVEPRDRFGGLVPRSSLRAFVAFKFVRPRRAETPTLPLPFRSGLLLPAFKRWR